MAAYGANLGEHTIYRGTDNHIHELWREQPSGSWNNDDLTLNARSAGDAAPDAASDSGLAAYFMNGFQHAVYVTQDRHLHRLDWAGGQGTHDSELTFIP